MKALITLLIVVVLWGNVLGKSPSNNAIHNKIKLLNSKIENYKYRVKNPPTSMNPRSKNNRKGWYYKKNTDAFGTYVQPINTLPKKYKKKDVKIVYYTKAERKVYLKKKYLAIVQKLEKEKAALLNSSNVSETQKPKAKYHGRAALLLIQNIEQKITLLDRKIKDYKQRAINPPIMGSLRSKDNRKGWRYKGGSAFSKKDKARVNPMSKLPKNYRRKKIQFVYYTKAERKVYLRKKYTDIAVKLEKEKEKLLKEIEKTKEHIK